MTLPGAPALQIIPVHGLGEVQPGDDLAQIILSALQQQHCALVSGDILVVTQKIVSKAEGRLVRLSEVAPSELAVSIASRCDKDARVVELVLRESVRIVRLERGVLIAETRHAFVCANAGVDASNVAADIVALLPLDPDASAESLRRTIAAETGVTVGVVISDTFGRAWREGQTDVAIGIAGVRPLRRLDGKRDPAGYELRVTALATAAELASAAELVMGKLDRVPVALVRGCESALGNGSIRELVRPPEQDLFR